MEPIFTKPASYGVVKIHLSILYEKIFFRRPFFLVTPGDTELGQISKSRSKIMIFEPKSTVWSREGSEPPGNKPKLGVRSFLYRPIPKFLPHTTWGSKSVVRQLGHFCPKAPNQKTMFSFRNETSGSSGDPVFG